MDKIRCCVSNTFPRISYLCSKCEELRNWQIPEKNTSDRELYVNSNNDSISTESMNVALSLENGRKRNVNSKNALQLSNTRQIPNDLRDGLIFPIAREIFKDPVLASDGNTCERLAITK